MTTFTASGLLAADFSGVAALRHMSSGQPQIPATPGVYAVLLPQPLVTAPSFLERSVGGHFKSQDPTVAIDELKRNWISNTEVLYFGSSNNLPRRIGELAKFGRGRPVGHRGGRYLWQLTDHGQLGVAWCPTFHPSDEEARLLAEFVQCHGALPFANLAQPRRPFAA